MKSLAYVLQTGMTILMVVVLGGSTFAFAEEPVTRVHTVQTSGRPIATNAPLGGFDPFDWRSYRLPSKEDRNRPADGVIVMTSDRERLVTEPSDFNNSATNDDDLGEIIKNAKTQKLAGGGMVASVNQSGILGSSGINDTLLLLIVMMLVVVVLLSRIIFKKRKRMIRQDYHAQGFGASAHDTRPSRGLLSPRMARAPRAPRAPRFGYPPQAFAQPMYQPRY